MSDYQNDKAQEQPLKFFVEIDPQQRIPVIVMAFSEREAEELALMNAGDPGDTYYLGPVIAGVREVDNG